MNGPLGFKSRSFQSPSCLSVGLEITNGWSFEDEQPQCKMGLSERQCLIQRNTERLKTND